MKKRLSAVFLAFVLTLSLAACGSGGSGAGTSSGSDDEASGPSEGSSGGDASLTIWAWDQTFNILAMKMAAEQYAETHEGFSVEIVETSSDDCETKLITCANAGDYSTMADIILMQDNSFQKYLKAYPDAFTELSAIDINWDDFGNLKQSYSMLDGAHYGVPYDNGAVIGCYRTDILAEAGYTIEDLTDITWSRFIEIGEDVYAKTGKYLVSGTSTGGDTLMMMIQSCGDNWIDEDGNVYIAGNETGKKCVELYVEMIQKNVFQLVNNWDEYIASITNSTVAGIINGNWITATLMTTEDQTGLWEITDMPRVDGVDSATNYANNGGSSWYISANCKNVDLAMDFLAGTFGSSTEFYDSILPKTGAIACYLPAGESDVYNEPVPYFNNQAIFSQIVGYSSHIPGFISNPYHYEARDVLDTAVINIVNGADIDAELQNAQETQEFNVGS